MDPSSSIVAATGLRKTFSSLCTETFAENVSTTKIREELQAKTQCPFAENEKSKASPPGRAADEVGMVEIRFIVVFCGRR